MARLLDKFSKANEPGLTCTITSPPYGNLKNYGSEDQIGWGQPFEDYLAEMRRVFRTIYQHTRDDGSMWVIADSIIVDEGRRSGVVQPLVMLPYVLAEQAADAGWTMREQLVWHKKKTLPWSSGGRLRNVVEFAVLFVKSSSYKFRIDRLREIDNLEEWWVKWPERYNPNGKAPSNLWDVPIPQQGSWGATDVQHACPLPPDLVERMLCLSTDEGDVVFDPFAGTGTVVAEANRLGRQGIGIELNSQYVKRYNRTVQKEVARRNANDAIRDQMARAASLRSKIISLRALKYPKVLWQQSSNEPGIPSPQFIVALASKINPETMSDPSHPLSLKALFVYPDDTDSDILDRTTHFLKDAVNRAPLTKYGIAGEPQAIRVGDISMYTRREKLYRYERGRTWDATGRVMPQDLPGVQPSAPARTGNWAYPTVVGNLEVHEQAG
jgi:DNA modification methylase